MRGIGREVCQFYRAIRLARSHYVEGCINRGAAEVTLFILHRIGLYPTAEQAQEHRLQHVLGIRGVAGNPVRRAEDQAVMRSETSFEFVRNRDRCVLFQYARQITPPVLSYAPKDGQEDEFLHDTKLFLERGGWHRILPRKLLKINGCRVCRRAVTTFLNGITANL